LAQVASLSESALTHFLPVLFQAETL